MNEGLGLIMRFIRCQPETFSIFPTSYPESSIGSVHSKIFLCPKVKSHIKNAVLMFLSIGSEKE